MSRAAKLHALRVIGGYEESDSDEQDGGDIDDIHDDVRDPSDRSPSSSGSENDDDISEIEEEPDPNHYLLARDNTQWHIIDENTAQPGRANRANVLQPAPGLTAYAYQRIMDHQILDSFLIFFNRGE